MTNKEIDIWIAALRSGEYKQGTERLCEEYQGTTYWCCMGVAVDKLCDGYWEVEYETTWSYKKSVSWAPQELIPRSVARDLIDFNDAELWSFAKIAKWIDANRGLFLDKVGSK